MRRYQNNKLFGFHKLQGLANGDDARLEEFFNKMQSRGYTAVALAELTKTSTAPSPLASASSPTHIPLPFTHQQIRWQGQCCTYRPDKYAAAVFKGEIVTDLLGRVISFTALHLGVMHDATIWSLSSHKRPVRMGEYGLGDLI